MISTILLDAGGVLLDETDHEDAWARAISDVVGISPAEYRDDVEESVRNFCPRVYRYVIWKHTTPDLAHFTRAWQHCRDHYEAHRPELRIMPGIADELNSLNGRLDIGIAGQYGAELLDTLSSEGLLDLFTYRTTQDQFELTKPDPRYLLQIAAACGVAPEECIEVGDRIDKDVIPAKQAGMATIFVRTGIHREQQPRLPEEIPDRELQSVVGLAAAALDIAGKRGLTPFSGTGTSSNCGTAPGRPHRTPDTPTLPLSGPGRGPPFRIPDNNAPWRRLDRRPRGSPPRRQPPGR